MSQITDSPTGAQHDNDRADLPRLVRDADIDAGIDAVEANPGADAVRRALRHVIDEWRSDATWVVDRGVGTGDPVVHVDDEWVVTYCDGIVWSQFAGQFDDGVVDAARVAMQHVAARCADDEQSARLPPAAIALPRDEVDNAEL